MANEIVGWNEDREINYEGIEAGPPKPVHGVCLVKVVKAEPRQQGTKEKVPGFELQLRVESYVNGEEIRPARTVYDSYTFSDGALFRIVGLSKATDVDMPRRTGVAHVKEFCRDLIGKKFFAHLELETYTKKTGEEKTISKLRAHFANQEDAEKFAQALAERNAAREALDAAE